MCKVLLSISLFSFSKTTKCCLDFVNTWKLQKYNSFDIMRSRLNVFRLFFLFFLFIHIYIQKTIFAINNFTQSSSLFCAWLPKHMSQISFNFFFLFSFSFFAMFWFAVVNERPRHRIFLSFIFYFLFIIFFLDWCNSNGRVAYSNFFLWSPKESRQTYRS